MLPTMGGQTGLNLAKSLAEVRTLAAPSSARGGGGLAGYKLCSPGFTF